MLPFDVPPRWPRALVEDPDWKAAIDAGVDVTLLESNLRLSVTERIRQLDDMLALAAKIQGTAPRQR